MGYNNGRNIVDDDASQELTPILLDESGFGIKHHGGSAFLLLTGFHPSLCLTRHLFSAPLVAFYLISLLSPTLDPPPGGTNF